MKLPGIENLPIKVSGREKKLVFVVLLILILFALDSFLLSPFFERQKKVREEIAIKEKTLEKYLSIVNKRMDLEVKLISYKASLSYLQGRLFSGNAPSLAAAELQDLVKKVASKNGVNILSTRVLSPEKIELYKGIPLQIQIEADLESLIKFIYDIENSGKILNIPLQNIVVNNDIDPTSVRATLIIKGFMKD